VSGILNGNRNNKRAGECGAKTLHVRGFPFDNTAAKFWTCLFDEVIADYPPLTRVELSALSGGLLVPDLLTPEASLRRDMEKMEGENIQEAFSDALAALEVLGPPPAVNLRLVPPPGQGEPQTITLEYLDAEILPFLLAWLLEWSAVPDLLWNEDRVRGSFSAQDRARKLVYQIAFEMTTHHVSEGLYERKVQVHFQRDAG
jgi:hypothetical protein